MKKLRILAVDDHQFLRKGLVATIRHERPDWDLCGEAATGREAVAYAARLKPDIVVMDISMPDMNGLEATRQILKDNPQTEVLILSMHESDDIVREALNSGARGYLLKSDAGKDLIGALEALGEHKPFFTRTISEVVLRDYINGLRSGKAIPASRLSVRERQIVQVIAEGKSNKEAASVLNISVKTVETHRGRVMAKLDLHSVSDLVRYAIRNRIVEP